MVREGRFERWSPFMLLGRGVAGATLGIVGMGRIGQAVARRAAGLGHEGASTRGRAVRCRRTRHLPGARWEYRAALDELLGEADIVSLHVPLTPDTQASHRGPRAGAHAARIVPGQHRARPGRSTRRLWWTRCKSGHLGGAGLDVYEREPELAPGLADLPNVTLLPHLGSATVETRGRMAELAALNAIAAVRGEPVPHLVNPRCRTLRRCASTCRGPGTPLMKVRPAKGRNAAALQPTAGEGRRLLSLLLLALLFAGVVVWTAACAPDDSGSDSTSSPPPRPPAAPSGDIEGTVGEEIKVGKAIITVRVLEPTFNPVAPEQR